MDKSTNRDASQEDSTGESTSLMPVEIANPIGAEQFPIQAAVLATETNIPLVRNIETMTSAIRLIGRETREQTRHARVMDTALKIIAFGTTLISLAILVGVVYLLKDVLTLVVVSFLIAYILSPIVDIIERKGVNRTLIVIAMTLLILSGFAFASTVAVNNIAEQVVSLSKDVQNPERREDLVDRATEWLNRTPEFLRSSLLAYLDEREEAARAVEGIIIEATGGIVVEDAEGPSAREPVDAPMQVPPPSSAEKVVDRERVSGLVTLAQEEISRYVMGESKQVLSAVSSSARGAFSAFTTSVVILFLTFFLLNGGQQLKKAFIQVVPNRFFEPTLVLIDELDQQLGGYLRSRLVQTILLSMLCAIGYWILGLRFAILLGIIAGLANLMPYIGPFIGAIPAIIVVFLGSRLGIGWSLLAVVILTLVIQTIDNAIITPLVLGKSVELGPVTTIIIVLIGEQLLGLIGLLMAVPIAAMSKLICQEVWTQFKGYSRSILQRH